MLFTFPSQYLFAIGLQGVFSLGGWSRLIHTGFLVSRATWDADRPASSACKGLSPATASLSRLFQSIPQCHVSVPQPRQGRNPVGLGCAPFARRYLGYHSCFLFLGVLRCFSSPRLPLAFARQLPEAVRLPRSDIRGSKVACTYPRLLAACHVLLRLLEPRYPPSALAFFSFTLEHLRARRSRILVFV